MAGKFRRRCSERAMHVGEYDIYADGERARMADRTLDVGAGPARDLVREHPVTGAIERGPARSIAAARDHHAWRADGCGDVRYAGVIAYQEPGVGQQGGKRAERGLAGEIDRVPTAIAQRGQQALR